MRALFFVAIIAIVHSTLGFDRPCGGLLEADAGEYKFRPEEALQPGQVCVWIVKLMSRQTVQFNLTELGQGLTVSLYPEHNPSELAIDPIRLNSSRVGTSIASDGQTLVVVLTPNGSDQRLAFTWDSLADASQQLLSGANYVNQESGQVSWNRFNNKERLTLSLNADQSQTLDVEAIADFRDCTLVAHCQCSYVGIYEIASDGSLREVSIACDRPSQLKVQNLFPNVLAFVYLNSSLSVSSADFAEIKWNVSKSDVPSTTEPPRTTAPPTTNYPTTNSWATEPPTTTYPTSTPPPPINVTNECGGPALVGRGQSVINYFTTSNYQNDQFCVWTLVPSVVYSDLTINYVGYQMDGYDGVSIFSWDGSGDVTTIQMNYTGAAFTLGKPYAAIAFSSDHSNVRQGFRITLTGTGSYSADYNYQGIVLKQNGGAYSYPQNIGLPNYQEYERVAVVVQPSVTIATEVSVDFTDINGEFLKVYQLYPYQQKKSATLIGTTTGSHPNGDPNLTSVANWPRLLIFHSNEDSNTGKGFSISWNTVYDLTTSTYGTTM